MEAAAGEISPGGSCEGEEQRGPGSEAERA